MREDAHGPPVILVEPFGVGGGVDVIAGALAGQLSQIWGIPVKVANRPGLGATAGPAFVAEASPDGRTLLINTSAHAYSAALAAGLPYDPISDFVAISPVTRQPYVLVAPKNSGIRTLTDLASEGQRRPGRLRFISAGVGTGTHLSVEQLNFDIGISAIHEPARPTDAIAATTARVAAGEFDYSMTPIPIAQPHLVAGTLVALGVSGARRSRLLPDVPTIAEAGVSGFDFPIWYGIWAPRATPLPIVNELYTGIATAMTVPELLTWFAEHDAEPINLTQPEFADFVERERDRAASIARAAGIAKA